MRSLKQPTPSSPTPDTSSPTAGQINSLAILRSYSGSPLPHPKSVWILVAWQEVAGRLVVPVPRVASQHDRDLHLEPVYQCVYLPLADNAVNPVGDHNRSFAQNLDKSARLIAP